jgi:hypothetical protein
MSVTATSEFETDVRAQEALAVASKELLCCVGASLPSQKFGAWIVDEIRGTRVRLVSGNLKADKWLSLEVVESMLQLVKRHRADEP